jgi:hypothetical protein
MNAQQKEMTVGYAQEILTSKAETLAARLAEQSEMEKEITWSDIAFLLAQAKALDTIVVEVQRWVGRQDR